MGNEKNEEKTEDWLKNLPVQTKNQAFSAEEMILCEKCERKNPPNRLKCFYCGNELPISETQADSIKPNLRKLEIWENGFNLVYLADENFEENNLSEVSAILGIESDILNEILISNKSLPLARAETETEAGIVQKNLQKFGIETFVLSDEVLEIKNPPKRIRQIEFLTDSLKLVSFDQKEIFEIPINDLAVMVVGKIFRRNVEAVEQHKRKGEREIVSAAETAFEESLIDIYAKDFKGFRIFEKGFDFSCLGEEKELLAAKNMPKLVEKLKSFAPKAKFVDDYVEVRKLLGVVWEIESKTASKGFDRRGFGKMKMKNLSTANNLAQITKYSRLQKHIT